MSPIRHSPRLSLSRRRLGRQAEPGFTLIELMVTLVLLAVLLTLSAPSFIAYQRNAELTSAANSFIAALSAARSEAMKRQVRAFVIPLSGTNWATGWQVFVDTDSSVTAASVAPGTGDIVIAQQAALQNGVAVTASSFPVAGTAAYAMFNGNGSMTLLDKTFQSGSLELTNGTESRRIIANPEGRLRVCKPSETGCTESAF